MPPVPRPSRECGRESGRRDRVCGNLSVGKAARQPAIRPASRRGIWWPRGFHGDAAGRASGWRKPYPRSALGQECEGFRWRRLNMPRIRTSVPRWIGGPDGTEDGQGRAPARLHQHRRGELRRRRRDRRGDPARQPDEPVRRRAGTRADRGRHLEDRRRLGDQDGLAQAADFHPQSHAEGDRGGGRGAALVPARSADAGGTHQARQEELADHAWRLHPSRLRAARRRRGREQGAVRRLFLPLPRLGI